MPPTRKRLTLTPRTERHSRREQDMHRQPTYKRQSNKRQKLQYGDDDSDDSSSNDDKKPKATTPKQQKKIDDTVSVEEEKYSSEESSVDDKILDTTKNKDKKNIQLIFQLKMKNLRLN